MSVLIDTEVEFVALFLNEAGHEAKKQGVETYGKDQYFTTREVTINVTRVEAYYIMDHKFENKECINVYMMNGESFTFVISYKNFRATRKWIYFKSN